MKTYILLDKNNIVRCRAFNPDNLHLKWSDDKFPTLHRVKAGGICGDEYNPETEKWTSRPENYPEPNDDEKIAAEVARIREQRDRSQAIQNLKQRGELPKNYTEGKT